MTHSRGGPWQGIGLVVGIAIGLWTASGYVAASMRAADSVYDVGEGRPVWKTLPFRPAITRVVVALLAAIAVGVVFTGPQARRTGATLGPDDTAVTVRAGLPRRPAGPP